MSERPQTFAFTVPGTPVPCARARVVRNILPDGSSRTRGVTPSKTSSYEERVALIARSASARARWRPTAKAFLLDLMVFRAVRAGDWDNFGKGVCDALTKARIWPDDRYVEDARVRLFLDREHPRVDVVVQELHGCAHCALWSVCGKSCPEHDDGNGQVVE